MIIFDQLYWREPWWLLLFMFPVVKIFWQQVQQRFSLRLYADAALLPWVAPWASVSELQTRHYWRQVLLIFIWLLFSIAAAGPRLLLSLPAELLPPQGEMVMVVDQSRSMQATDVFPNRLQQAHTVVKQWINEKDEIKKGLIIFAGASHVVLPLTFDKDVLQETVLLLDKIQLPTHGSAMVDALLQAKALFSNDAGERAIFLLTDADVATEKFKELQQVVKQLQQKNITLYLLGIGEPFPVALTDNFGRWLQYNGETVFTQLQESALQTLSKNENVFYYRLNLDAHEQLSNIWQTQGGRIAAQDYDKALWYELFPWFLIAALLLTVMSKVAVPFQLMPSYFFSSMRIKLRAVIPVTFFVMFVVMASIMSWSVQATERTAMQLAYDSWIAKDYEAAADHYAVIEGYSARMGEGASCFRAKKIACAITAFSRAAWQAETDEQHGRAAFNLANSFFKQGDFKSAITLYKDALRYQPEQVSYKNNLQFSEEVQRNIERRLQQEAKSQANAPVTIGWKLVDSNNALIANTNISLADIKNEVKKIGTMNISKEQLAQYMLRSQKFARLSQEKPTVRKRHYDWRRFNNENPVAARKVEYWQKLFELEEGIPAHHDEPDVIPGVRPW